MNLSSLLSTWLQHQVAELVFDVHGNQLAPALLVLVIVSPHRGMADGHLLQISSWALSFEPTSCPFFCKRSPPHHHTWRSSNRQTQQPTGGSCSLRIHMTLTWFEKVGRIFLFSFSGSAEQGEKGDTNQTLTITVITVGICSYLSLILIRICPLQRL